MTALFGSCSSGCREPLAEPSTVSQFRALPASSASSSARPVRPPRPLAPLPKTPLAYQPVCSADSWCWRNPLPQGETLRDIWGSRADNVYAVGDTGTILHFDGKRWRGQPRRTDRNLSTVWVGDEDVVFVGVAKPRVFDYPRPKVLMLKDGGYRMLDIPIDPIDIWGSSSADVFAVGAIWGRESATIAHFDGRKWSPMSHPAPGAVTAVWGRGPKDVFAADSEGHVLHYDGKTWSDLSAPRLGQNVALGGNDRTVVAV